MLKGGSSIHGTKVIGLLSPQPITQPRVTLQCNLERKVKVISWNGLHKNIMMVDTLTEDCTCDEYNKDCADDIMATKGDPPLWKRLCPLHHHSGPFTLTRHLYLVDQSHPHSMMLQQLHKESLLSVKMNWGLYLLPQHNSLWNQHCILSCNPWTVSKSYYHLPQKASAHHGITHLLLPFKLSKVPKTPFTRMCVAMVLF